jgi:hypothetical protein
MTDPATPEKGAEEGTFKFGRDKEGNLLVEGVVVEKGGFLGVEPGEEDDEPEGGENIHVEGEAVAEPPKKEEVKEPEPEPEPKPEPPAEPEKKKYKYKAQGEEYEEELDERELLARLSMAQDYYQKTTKLAEDRRKIEPFLPIIEKPEFRQWLGEQVEAGVVDAPKQAPAPEPEDVIAFQLNMQDPEFNEIQATMSEWAQTLPAYEREALDSNHKVFNQTYTRFKQARKEKMAAVQPTPPPTPPPPQQTDPKTLEKIIQSKEVAKEQAKVETPGGPAPEVNPMKEWRRIDRELQRAVRERRPSVRYRGELTDPEAAWALHRYGRKE